MAIQMIGLGTSPNDDTGDPARTCFSKINSNFSDAENAASKLVATEAQAIAGDAGVLTDAAGVKAHVTSRMVGVVNAADTGALVQYGTGTNGEFWRFAGGMQVTKTPFRATGDINQAQGSLFRTPLLGPFQQPIAFVERPTTYVSADNEVPFYGVLGGVSVIYLVAYSPTSRDGANYSVTSIGRWK